MPEGQTAPKLGHEAPFMSVFPILLVTWVGTSAGFVTPYAPTRSCSEARSSPPGAHRAAPLAPPMPEAERISLSPSSRAAWDGPCS